MNILLVSQCNKNALAETRRVLDQFAERFGTRTWQTHITQQGLETVKKLLMRTARRNTAVACHWIRGKDHTELLWIVGNASFFSEKGTVPTNKTKKDILRSHDENDWHSLQNIKALSAIAALFHDFGKASLSFQKKLMKGSKQPQSDAYRHEWVSLRLFQAFVGSSDDNEWLSRLASLNQEIDGFTEKKCLEMLIKDGIDSSSSASPFKNLPPVARAVGWLILSHHFLPQHKRSNIKKLNVILDIMGPEFNNAQVDDGRDATPCWKFNKGTPFVSKSWRERASYWGNYALKRSQLIGVDWFDHLYSLHLARLSLMLADHHYSSLPADTALGDVNFPLYANTDKESKLKQRLDEHLIGVAKGAAQIVKALPRFERDSRRIKHKEFKKRTTHPSFRWQNDAYDLACSLRDRSATQGFFGVNMASTGCGKTLANGRIMYGLANPNRGARFSIALGLRSLTLQTGKSYSDRLGLKDDDLAVLVGSSAVKELFDLHSEEKKKADQQLASCGSESAESLMPDNSYIYYEGSLEIGPLKRWIDNKPEVKKLLAAPILVCTLDHLIGATENTRGGKQIAPMLRLLASDLVLDEVDDFDISDLPAISRLVHWVGLLGGRILLSSATLPPALVEGLFNAYKAGREMFQKSRGIHGNVVNICCAWFDENTVMASDHAVPSNFMGEHNRFVDKRIKKLREMDVRRRAIIKPLYIDSKEPAIVHQEVADAIHEMFHELHQVHHSVDPVTGKKVSFGVVRFANVDPLIDVAKRLFELGAKENHRIKLCCYHSRHLLLTRSNIEKQLDRLLDRHGDPDAIFKDRDLRKVLNNKPEDNILFIVLASPAAEVGRDHDYDWAIAEPSSMRSLIQLLGRIKRHREYICTQPNIYLLNTNIRSLKSPVGTVTYCKPGFENKEFLLNTHDLDKLLLPEQYEVITAEPRIRPRASLRPKENLADLEHVRLEELMLRENAHVALWWTKQATLSGILQQETRFRASRPQVRVAYLFDEDDDKLKFYIIEDDGVVVSRDYLFDEIKIEKMGGRIEPWITEDYLSSLTELAEAKGMELRDCALRFGWVDLEKNEDQNMEWCYHPALGLRRKL